MNPRNDDGKCQTVIHRRTSLGILGKGKESYTTVPAWCSRNAADGNKCTVHARMANERGLTRQSGLDRLY